MGKATTTREHSFRLRVWRRAARGKRCPRLLIKCGCCDQSLAIYVDPADEFLEINGVLASIDEWNRVLRPLLSARKTQNKRAVPARRR